MNGRLGMFAMNVLLCLQVAAISDTEDFRFRDEGYYMLVMLTPFR